MPRMAFAAASRSPGVVAPACSASIRRSFSIRAFSSSIIGLGQGSFRGPPGGRLALYHGQSPAREPSAVRIDPLFTPRSPRWEREIIKVNPLSLPAARTDRHDTVVVTELHARDVDGDTQNPRLKGQFQVFLQH